MVTFLPLVWNVRGDAPFAEFGAAVASAGDVNGDGYDDVIIGAQQFEVDDLSDAGRAFLYLGSATGLGDTEVWTASSDDDWAYFGAGVASAGDVNGDGYDDVVIGAPSYSAGSTAEGRAYLYLGSMSGLDVTAAWTVESDQEWASLGETVASAGDVDGDGYDDVIVGARLYDNGQTDEGRAFLFFGSASGLGSTARWTAESDQVGALFALDLSSAGDVNADGYDDVIVGAPGYDSALQDVGRAYLYLGSSTGPGMADAWPGESESGQGNVSFGSAVARVGDVNGDGFDDAAVGEPSFTDVVQSQGKAYVFLGNATGLEPTATWTATWDGYATTFGLVGRGGDLNADGYDDILVGAPAYSGPSAGRAYVYLGSPTGPAATPAWTGDPLHDSYGEPVSFGASVSIAGDVDADGYDDVVVGDHSFTNVDLELYSAGRAFVYAGGCYDPTDADADQVGDACDLCPDDVDPGQEDDDADGIGDACDPCRLGAVDTDADGVCPPDDCDDGNATVYPEAPELCDGLDNPCSGGVPSDEVDEDGDGSAICAGDCDNGDPRASPFLVELCGDAVDNNCNGAVDEACVLPADGSGCGCGGAGSAWRGWASLTAALGIALGRSRARSRRSAPSKGA